MGRNLFAALAASLMLHTLPVHAQNFSNGVIRPDYCTPATAYITKLRGTDAQYGFGASAGADESRAITVVNSGSGESGMNIGINYAFADPGKKGTNFRQLVVNLKESDRTDKNVTVRFCFSQPNGGIIVIDTKKLSDFTLTPLSGGWTSGTIKWSDFLGASPDVKQSSLVDVSYALKKQGNITLGGNTLTVVAGQVRPSEINTEPGDCRTLQQCGDN